MSTVVADMQTARSSKPVMLAPNLDEIPPELKAISRWVCWRLEWRDDDWAKVPIDARTGGRASSTDPSTWSDFTMAVSAMESFGCDGAGLTLSEDDELVGIDLDDCLDEEGRCTEAARQLLELFDSYAEVSPSGTGLKLFIWGRKNTAKCTSTAIEGIWKIEIYEKWRYFTVTGRRYDWAPNARQLGTRLRTYRRRVMDGVFLDNDAGRKRAGGAVWRLRDQTTGEWVTV